MSPEGAWPAFPGPCFGFLTLPSPGVKQMPSYGCPPFKGGEDI